MITVLTGENSYTTSQALKQLVKQFQGDVERFDGSELEPHQLLEICAGVTLFSSERLIVISSASLNKTVWVELEKWLEKVPDTTHLVFLEPKPDKRTKTYKLLAKLGEVREHKLLDESSLVSWVRAEARAGGAELPTSEATYFVGYVGHDQWRLGSELQKLLLSGKKVDRDLVHAVCEPYPEASAFELLDCVFAGKLERAEELLLLLAEREDPYKFLGLLSSQLLALLAIAVAGQRRNDEIAKDMGIHPYVVQKLVPVARRLGRHDIQAAVEKLADCDVRIKTSGVEPWDQLRRTLLTLYT